MGDSACIFPKPGVWGVVHVPFVNKLQAGPAGEQGTCEEGLRSRQGCQADRGSVPVVEGSSNVHVFVNIVLGCVYVCVCCTREHLYQLKRRKGTWLSMFTFYGGPICGCCWRQHLVNSSFGLNI